MIFSDCCGAATRVEYRPDRPFVYDDQYELEVPVLLCTKCGKVIGFDENQDSEDEDR